MRPTRWITVTLDYDRSTEFTNDDADRYTELVDLGGSFEFLTVIIPALSSSGTVNPYIQMNSLITTEPVVVHVLDDDATGSFAHATSSAAGGIVVTFRIGGANYLRLYVSTNQSADRVFYVRGFNR